MKTLICQILILTLIFSGQARAAQEPSLPGKTALELSVPDHVNLPPGSVKSVRVQAMSGNDADNVVAEALGAQDGRPVESVTVVYPDDHNAVHRSYFEKVAEAAGRFQAKSVHKIKVSPKEFSDWFVTNRLRITIIVFEVTLMTGLKFTELLISPVPIPYASAFASALLLGSILGVVEWYSPQLIDFIAEPGRFVKSTLERITGGAQASARNLKSRKVLETAWQFAKNTEINFVLFGVFKILLFATTQVDGSFAEGLVTAFQAVNGASVAEWAKLAVASTVVSFPTTKIIMQKHKAGMKEAGENAEKKRKVQTQTTLYMASALSARALLFSSIIAAGVLNMPLLAVTAYTGLGVMFTGSVAKLWYDARSTQRANTCSAVFATSGL